MKSVSILVPKGAILGSIEGPRMLLAGVNNYLAGVGKPPLFHIELVATEKQTAITRGMYTIHADKLLSEVSSTDLVIIPAIDGDLKKGLDENRELIPWVAQQ